MQIACETSRLMLREWVDADLEPFHAICSDPRVMQYVGNGHAWSREQTKSFIEQAVSQSHQHGYCQWALVLKGQEQPIGFCGYRPADDGAEIGWRLAFAHWGKGLGTEAARAALQHGFVALGFSRIMATVQAGNRASLRILEKLEMHPIGKLTRNGRDVLVYAKYNPG
jgi:RimJ/RimL family protein N-acetyltransferase